MQIHANLNKYKDIKLYALNKYRLYKDMSDNKEVKALKYLLEGNGDSRNNIEQIKDLILCMQKCETNYKVLDYREQDIVSLFKEHELIVNYVIVTLFQWFGTEVGNYKIKELLKFLEK